MYRMCSGQLPFRGKETMSTLMSIALDQPTPLLQENGDVPVELAELVMTLLEKDLDRRLASASDVVQALRAIETKGTWRKRKPVRPGAGLIH
jgi:serine/threonine protein kinase